MVAWPKPRDGELTEMKDRCPVLQSATKRDGKLHGVSPRTSVRVDGRLAVGLRTTVVLRYERADWRPNGFQRCPRRAASSARRPPGHSRTERPKIGNRRQRSLFPYPGSFCLSCRYGRPCLTGSYQTADPTSLADHTVRLR